MCSWCVYVHVIGMCVCMRVCVRAFVVCVGVSLFSIFLSLYLLACLYLLSTSLPPSSLSILLSEFFLERSGLLFALAQFVADLSNLREFSRGHHNTYMSVCD